jgi:5-methylcytosine-specific restriction endonuclease McrA
MRYTEAEIEALKTPAGGWKRKTLEKLGVPWPPPKGWKKALIAGDPIPKSKVVFRKRSERERKKLRKRARRRLLHAHGDVFYNSKQWQKMRIKVLAVYGRKCMKCDRVDGAMHIDHIKPRSKFPELSLTFDNLQVLCPDCNIEKWNYHATDYRDESAGRDLDLQTVAELRNWL